MSEIICIPDFAKRKPKGFHKKVLRLVGFDIGHGGAETNHICAKQRVRSTYMYIIFEIIFAGVSIYSLATQSWSDLSNLSWIIISVNIFLFVLNFGRSRLRYIRSMETKKLPPASSCREIPLYNCRFFRQQLYYIIMVCVIFFIVFLLIAFVAYIAYSMKQSNLDNVNELIIYITDWIKLAVLWASILFGVAIPAGWKIFDTLHELWGYKTLVAEVLNYG